MNKPGISGYSSSETCDNQTYRDDLGGVYALNIQGENNNNCKNKQFDRHSEIMPESCKTALIHSKPYVAIYFSKITKNIP